MLVWECVIAFRGHDCGSALIETSTHNKRTECLWQDFNVLVMCFAVLSNPKRNLKFAQVIYYEPPTFLCSSLCLLVQN